jgi:CheY-like chemotaxis protein
VEATKRIRSSGTGFKNTPVIALTAYAMSGDRDKFLQAGMDDYLAKPIDKDRLMAVLKKHLPRVRD